MSRHLLLGLSLITVAALAACRQQEPPSQPDTPARAVSSVPAPAAPDPAPPAPPIRETFEGEPQLSLFPRVGDFRPEDHDTEGLSIWATYIDHLSRTSGVLANKHNPKGQAFGFRSIKAVDSVGFFSPVAVEPGEAYRVAFRLWSKLSPGGTTGVGILEYDEFLFIPEQFPKSLSEKHFLQSQLGIKLTDDHDGKLQSFTFQVGPKTRMIHLVFFREGTPDRHPVVIDDIEISREP